MPNIQYSFNYQNNQKKIVISPDRLIATYFFGVKICSPSGIQLRDEDIVQFIQSAQEQIEDLLGLKIFPTVIRESQEFYRDDWNEWGMVRTNYPVVGAFEMDGFVNTVKQIHYPKSWLTVRKTSDGKNYRRSIFLVPNQGGEVNQGSVVFNGITPHLGFYGMANVPSYWNICYITGFDNIPANIIEAICFLASVPIYMFLGNGILTKAGLNSQSISIDGLSQSQSIEAGGYTAKLKQITERLYGQNGKGGLLNNLKSYYNSFELTSC